MGIIGSKIENGLGEHFPERYTGLQNFGNTCYCNSVLQALYYCVPFREKLLDHYSHYKNPNDGEDNILKCLADLFIQMSSNKKKHSVIPPTRFLCRMKNEYESFRNYMHQDAHEFLNYLLNGIVNILEKDLHKASSSLEYKTNKNRAIDPRTNGFMESNVTWLHKFFQGILVNETRCLRCETVTARDETFLDLSIDVEQNSSIISCLKNFCSTYTLNADDKFFCDQCCSLQEAQKRMKIKKTPRILVIHLKRFKYLAKLSYRVVFPMELKLNDIAVELDTEYSLFAVVIHVGNGFSQGHYVSAVKSNNHWVHFDDDIVNMINESVLQTYFGLTQESLVNVGNGYLLFYEMIQPATKIADEVV